jgi:hypothetical protein
VSLVSLTPGNPMRTVALSVLIFEVVVFGLAVPVMIFVSNVPAGVAAALGGGAALLALVAAALLRRPLGYAIGWLTQLVGVSLGVLTPGMFVVGGIFLALWVLCFVLGKKLDAHPASD